MDDIIYKNNNWVDLRQLPRYNGKSRIIKWKECKNCNIPFYYNGKHGVIHIKEVLDNGNILVTVDSSKKNFSIRHDLIVNLMLSYLIGDKTFDYKYHIDDKISTKQGCLIIKRQIRIQMSKNTSYTQKGYEVECSCCKHLFKRTEYQLSKGHDIICPVCLGREVKNGFNDIATTDPWMLEYLVDKKDALKYTNGSNKKILFQCPICKKIKLKSVIQFKQKGLGCCSDGISYGEKFLKKLFDMCDIEYIYQLNKATFAWCGNYRYDFYLPKYNWIIEVMGGQHYYESGVWQELKCIKENDNKKRDLAKQYIDNYIELDVRCSELKTIKESIIKSKLKSIIDVNSIDYKFLHFYAKSNSIILSICKDYQENYPNISTKDLAEKYNISQRTVGIHLKFGAEYGLCNYIPQTHIPIMVNRNNIKYVFNSIQSLCKYSKTHFDINLNGQQIHKYANSDIEHSGMLFYSISKYDFNNYYDSKHDESIIVIGKKFKIKEVA